MTGKKMKSLIFQDRFDILPGMRLSGVAEQAGQAGEASKK